MTGPTPALCFHLYQGSMKWYEPCLLKIYQLHYKKTRSHFTRNSKSLKTCLSSSLRRQFTTYGCYKIYGFLKREEYEASVKYIFIGCYLLFLNIFVRSVLALMQRSGCASITLPQSAAGTTCMSMTATPFMLPWLLCSGKRLLLWIGVVCEGEDRETTGETLATSLLSL